MAKRIILYNLADNMTEEAFKKYVTSEKGPLIDSLPGVKKYELVKIEGPGPYRYAGVVHLTSLEEYEQKATKTQSYQDFIKKFGPMVKDMVVLDGNEIY